MVPATSKVGGVIENDIPTYRTDHMPYGGVKDSGLGREGLRWAIENMTGASGHGPRLARLSRRDSGDKPPRVIQSDEATA